ncbi:LysR family transcriptional regulator [Novosphingobium profundi]|uniref:LysR family transcriptional regulator n=1 Tax=Novosphingobium profundi TaxID=1774954 RepID=UPI001BDAD764|nr:LysR family transcriptional regulator [Novosphingobium profundi]MBT0671724.1 LysR family transcriptional regulator [Novosphingobium profundi]
MQIRQLRHFLAAVDTGSMTLASMSQNITQPTLSRSIKTLEDELGVDLFERGHRGVQPTRYGHMLADHARSIVHGMDQALEDVGAMRAGGLGHVRIGVGSNAADPRLTAAFARIAVEAQDITLTIEYDIPDNQFARLRRGELDALVEARRPDLDSGDLDFCAIAEISMVLVARAGHPVHRLGRVPRRELAHWPWAIFHQPNADAFYRGLLELENEEHNIRVRSSSPAMLHNLLLEEDLIGMMSRVELAEYGREGRLRVISSDVRQVETSLCLITRRRSHMSGALRAVTSQLRSAFRNPVGGAPAEGSHARGACPMPPIRLGALAPV